MSSGRKQKADDYVTLFRGIKLRKRNANVAGLSLIFGMIGMSLTLISPYTRTRYIAFPVILIFVIAGFSLGNRIFKRE
ncbi:hypothetical protein MNBD_DELTA01-394 [hydrothermal vent metagenome]|uniref:Uncharacterized protein n=1 Tax=hydrothermal vent metagenome TaxID=652676 RepID=A0A3B0QUF6_9ZZZZ